jgi:hypothetical protein
MQLAPFLFQRARNLQETAMNTLPLHNPETGDLRALSETVAMPGDISVGDLPNSDTPTDDMRGLEPSATMEPEKDNTGMIAGAAVVAALIGGIGIVSYTMGAWDSAPATPAPHVVASNNALPALPAVVPQQPAVSASAVPTIAVEQPPILAPTAKRSAAPSHRSAVRTPREPVMATPETALPETTSPVIAPAAPVAIAPLESAPISPVLPTTVPALPVTEATPTSQTPPAQPPQ